MTTGRLRAGVLALGGLSLAAAIGWWWLTFGEVTRSRTLSWEEAGACLMSDGAVCRLAAALCTARHPLLFAAYSSAALWIAIALVLAGTLLPRRA